MDVISIAMEELNQQRRQQRKQKVLPADDDTDPDIYVEQIITIEAPDVEDEVKNAELADSRFYVDTKTQVARWLRNQDDPSLLEDVDSDDEEDIDGSDANSYMSDDAANRRAL